MSIRSGTTALSVWASFCLVAAECRAQYTVTEVPTLGGSWSIAHRINSSGAVVGSAALPDNVGSHGFIFDSSGFRDLAFLGDIRAAMAINDAGGILGNSLTLEETLRWSFYQFGKVTELTAPDGSPAVGVDVNNEGTVVGRFSSPNGNGGRAFSFRDGELTDLGTLGGSESRAAQINDRGQIVGASSTEDGRMRAFLYEDGRMMELEDPGGVAASAEGINEAGQVIGIFEIDSDHWLHPFLYSDGVMVELAKDQGLEGNYLPMAINNRGSIVGAFDIRAEVRGWVYTEGVLLDLNLLIPHDSGWFLTVAYDINDAGQIVGSGFLNGAARGFILTPVIPEPRGVGILGGAILVALNARISKRRVT